jgi:serine/threonine protein kinase
MFQLGISNIFLKRNGQIKLGDFNIAKLIENSTSLSRTSSARNNFTSHVGTSPYMSPEMISYKTYSYETDCWLVEFYFIFKLAHVKFCLFNWRLLKHLKTEQILEKIFIFEL